MKKVYSAENLQAAYLVQGMLNEAGIASKIFNEYAQGGMGEIPFTHTYPEIWLENELDESRARVIIQRFEQKVGLEQNLTCPQCGEQNPDTFETCWKCGSSLS